MKLSIPFFQKKEESPDYYLALLLTSEKTSILALEKSEEKLKIVSKQEGFFKDNIENISIEELIDTVDHTVSKTAEVLPAHIEIRKTVLGVKENWVEAETKKIKKIYLQKLKKVCDALELSPIGFIVASEAISNLIQEEEGAPLSAIFAELGKKYVSLTLFRGGKSIQVVEGDLKDDYTSTIDELLKQFTIEVLPARIILYNSKADNQLVQQFIGYQWSKSLPFLHMPQISILPPGFDGRAITAGAASQMGLELPDDEKDMIKTFENNALIAETITENEESGEVSNIHNENTDNEEIISGENFGFVAGHDVANMTQPHNHHKNPATVTDQAVIGDKVDIQNTNDIEDEKLIKIDSEDELDENFDKGQKFYNKISIPKISFPAINTFWFKGILIPAVILGLIAGGSYYMYFNKVKASIIVNLIPKNTSQSTDVVFTAEATNDYQNNIIAAKQIEGSLVGDMTMGASGKKDVGDKAQGEVTIYNNNTDKGISLSSGTEIKSANGLTFSLEKDVSVASASGDIFSGTKPGTANVKVTAKDIGTNFNLPSDTKFSVEGNSFMAAKNDNAFSGGTKKSVTVVSKDDLAKLKDELLTSLEKKVQDELVRKSGSNDIMLPIVLSTSVEQSKYDKNAGDESKTVKLTATIKFTGLSYQDADEKNYAKAVLGEKYSNNMTFDENNLEITLKDPKKESDKEISATLTMNAALLPRIETQELGKSLSGKPTKEAANIVSKLPQVKNMTVSYNPNISFLANLVPNLPNNVTVTLTSN